MRNYLKIKNKQKFVIISVLFLIISFATFFFFVNFNIINNNNNNITQEEKHDNRDYSFTNSNPKKSADIIEGELNLTSGKDINGKDINNTRYYHGSNITIEGKVFNGISGPLENVNVSLVIDQNLYPQYKNKTNANGDFQINFTIPNTLNIHCNHSIGVNVTDNKEIKYLNHYNIMVNTTSYFYKIDSTIPILTGENVSIVGSLRYENGTGIPKANFNYDWYDNATYLSGGIKLTTPSGAYPPIKVPDTSKSELILKFNYSAPPDVNYSETSINVMVFSGITCNWNVELEAYEGDQYLIEGQISNSVNSTIKINDRDVNLFYNKTFLATVKTNENGTFIYSYNIPEGTGSNIIRVELVTDVENKPFSTVSIVIDSVPPSEPAPPEPEPEPVPFQDFFLVFIPIIIGVVAGLSGYGYYYYRKQKRLSLSVNVPLESKIRNLKILNDTGRLEESISYLFNALYMELVNAKYGRVIKETETIRDFAIISVKELKLNPASIYPFIQIIEKVNYFPFKITEKDFYSTVELFSPIYFELTGYDFILNF